MNATEDMTEVLEKVRAFSDEQWATFKTLLTTTEARDPYTIPPTITDSTERARLLHDTVERMKANPLTGDPPRLTRDELHERR
jgi:hypothetical protein